MEFRSQNEASTQGVLMGVGQPGAIAGVTLGTARPRDLNLSHVAPAINGTPGLGAPASGAATSDLVNSQQVSQQVLLAEHSLQ